MTADKLNAIVGLIDLALGKLDQGVSGKEYDPSWIRPRRMSVSEMRDACESAYHLMWQAKAACIPNYAQEKILSEERGSQDTAGNKTLGQAEKENDQGAWNSTL